MRKLSMSAECASAGPGGYWLHEFRAKWRPQRGEKQESGAWGMSCGEEAQEAPLAGWKQNRDEIGFVYLFPSAAMTDFHS